MMSEIYILQNWLKVCAVTNGFQSLAKNWNFADEKLIYITLKFINIYMHKL